jgi:hypothetical protein
MKRSLLMVAVFLFGSLAFSASAQITVPPWVKAKYRTMPAPAAGNNQGLKCTPYLATHWYKGNLHCHSNTSGERMPKHGDGPPEATLQWYADHGYDFVVFTDHNYWHQGLAAPPGLLYIQGEEVTNLRFHENALGTKSYIRPLFNGKKVEVYQWAADQIVAQGGVAMINHPLTPLAFVTPADFARIKNVALFEVYNMQPGGYKKLGEPLWDNVLTRGLVYWGTATDDAHMFKSEKPAVGDPPGGGFVMVDAPERNAAAILAALRGGKFYASTGALIKRYEVSPESIKVEASDPSAKIEFIGAGGKVLKIETAARAEYRPAGDELYVRVRVKDAAGKLALLQPVFFK